MKSERNDEELGRNEEVYPAETAFSKCGGGDEEKSNSTNKTPCVNIKRKINYHIIFFLVLYNLNL